MQSITVKHNQCNLDISLMAFGTLERVYELPNLASGASITEELIVNSKIEKIPSVAFDKIGVSTMLSLYHLIPASIKNEPSILPKEGIGYWIIGQNFKVS